MMLRILLFITITSQVAFGQSTNGLRSKPFLFVDSLLTKNTYVVEFLDFEFPKDVQDILLRVQKSMAEKKEWSEEYFSKNYKPGEGLPYHENFGVTKEEYQKIKDLDKSPPTLVIKRTSTITVKRSADLISFEALEGDKFMEALTIDLKNELLFFITDTIPFYKEITVSSLKAYGNVQGYTWKEEVSNFEEKDELKMDSLISKNIEINIGFVQIINKILLTIKYKEINKGEIKANFEIACYLK